MFKIEKDDKMEAKNFTQEDDYLITISGNILIREIVKLINCEEERLEYDLDWNATDDFIVTIKDLDEKILYHETHSDTAPHYTLKDFIINFGDFIKDYSIALDFVNYIREDYFVNKKYYLSHDVKKIRERYVAEKLSKTLNKKNKE